MSDILQNLQSFARRQMAHHERVRKLEERVVKLEEEVRALTSMMRGTVPVTPITPWKSPFVYRKSGDETGVSVVGVATGWTKTPAGWEE